MKKINKKNLIKLVIMMFCTGIVFYDLLCISVLFATFTWFGFIEFILSFVVVYKLYEDLFKKKRTN